MKVYIITNRDGQIVSVYENWHHAVMRAENLEKSGEYPLYTLYVDEYTVE